MDIDIDDLKSSTINYILLIFTDNTVSCGEILTVSPWQIQQRNFTYLDGVYDVDLDCRWIIIAPNHYQITLEFGQIDIEGQYPCHFDYIQVSLGPLNANNIFVRKAGDGLYLCVSYKNLISDPIY